MTLRIGIVDTGKSRCDLPLRITALRSWIVKADIALSNPLTRFCPSCPTPKQQNASYSHSTKQLHLTLLHLFQCLPARLPERSLLQLLRIQPKPYRRVTSRYHFGKHPLPLVFAIHHLKMPPAPSRLVRSPFRTYEIGKLLFLGHCE